MRLYLMKNLYSVRATDRAVADLLIPSRHDPLTGKKLVRFANEDPSEGSICGLQIDPKRREVELNKKRAVDLTFG